MDGGAEVAILMLSEVSLTRLASELGNEWRSLGIFLGVPKAQVDQCDINHPRDVRAAIVDMLVMWQQETSVNGPQAQVADLVQALKDIGRVDLAERVEVGDFIGHPDQGTGNRKYPYQEAGNRAESRGDGNVIIQAGDHANITVAAPFTGRGAANEGYGAAASAMPTPGYTSLPVSRTHQPRPIPQDFSQDGVQHSQEYILENCIRQLQEMGFTDEGTKQEVKNLISTGLAPQYIVQTIVDGKAQEHEEVNQQQSFPNNIQPQSDGQDSSSSEESEDSASNPGELSSTFDSLDGTTTGEVHQEPTTSPLQNPTGGSPDASLSDESLRLQSGGNMQDNLASNRPEAGIRSSADDGDDVPVRPLGDLYPESSQPSTMPALLDCSIPSIGQQPLSPLPAVQSDPQLSQKQEDETIGGVEESSNLREHQPTEVVAAASGEDTAADVGPDDVSTSDEETLPKAPLEDASANEAATAAPASDQLHPAETQEQVKKGADGAGDQPVYDTERRLYIFSRAHIEKMTENFSPSKKIADGAFGPVYFLEKFSYDVDGPSQDRPLKDRPLAIKVNRSEDQGPREFKQELVMAGYRHPHILPLIGICEDEGCLALIYAYMDNKDLLTHMKDQAQRPLNYKQRLLISLDLISAVLYYHRTKRFHRDIKSANVLLDGNYRARLGDPGLMRELPSDKSHLSHTGHSAARCGTTHYQDPYYVESGQFHETSDTFSAGKVLLELLTGKPADAVDKDGFVLFHNWCHQQRYRYFLDDTGKRLCEVADHSDEGWPKVTEDGKSVTQRFAKLIVGCLQSHPTDRINLEVLYQELKDLAKTAGVLGTFSAVMPTVCTYCLACKPCSIPMSCGCVSVCVACMKKNSGALYCTNHHTETTGLGQNTFAVLVGMKGRKRGEQGFGKDAEEMYKVLTDPNICAVRPENVKLLTNGKGTSENIKKAVKELGQEVNKVPESQQKCLLYYHSGHGELGSTHTIDRYLLCEDKNMSSCKMKKLFAELCPTRSLYILDVCYASSVQLYMNKDGEQPEASENLLKPFIPQGSLLWASSRSYEPSQVEKSATAEDKISVFTKYILAGLRGGDKSLKDKTQDLGGMPLNFLQDYVFDEVKKEVGDKQTPSISGQDEKTYWIAYPPED